jgi:hypothetical protein
MVVMEKCLFYICFAGHALASLFYESYIKVKEEFNLAYFEITDLLNKLKSM